MVTYFSIFLGLTVLLYTNTLGPSGKNPKSCHGCNSPCTKEPWFSLDCEHWKKKALLIKDGGVPRKIVIDSYVLLSYSFTLVLDAWPSLKLVHNLYTYYKYYNSKYHTVIMGVMCTLPSFGGPTMQMPTPTSIWLMIIGFEPSPYPMKTTVLSIMNYSY